MKMILDTIILITVFAWHSKFKKQNTKKKREVKN